MNSLKNAKRSIGGINPSDIYSAVLRPCVEKDWDDLTMFELKQILIGNNSN